MKEPAGSDPNRLFFGKIKKEADLKSVSSLYSFGPAECLEAVLSNMKKISCLRLREYFRG